MRTAAIQSLALAATLLAPIGLMRPREVADRRHPRLARSR
jgi:hypothetical protein